MAPRWYAVCATAPSATPSASSSQCACISTATTSRSYSSRRRARSAAHAASSTTDTVQLRLRSRDVAAPRRPSVESVKLEVRWWTWPAIVVPPGPPVRHALERPPFPSRIQRDGHRRSGAEGGQQQIVRAGPAVGPTGGDGLVGDEPVAPDGDLLDESLRAAAHDHQALLQWLDHDVTSCDRLKELTSLPALRVLTPPSPRGPHPLSPSEKGDYEPCIDERGLKDRSAR